ncbi:hypothetical protein DFJ63DRAFT_337017 [Scheffersomyces coipomensis]|uniref:uncharacterized protein n=1 Tax=Scheffersomyces coipomensis TaxID=1788519 RepID=UPI00315C619A
MKIEGHYQYISMKFIWRLLICSNLLYLKIAAESINIPTSNQVSIVEGNQSQNGIQDNLERLRDHLNILKYVLPLRGNATKIEELKHLMEDRGVNNNNTASANWDNHLFNNRTKPLRSPLFIQNPSLLQIDSHIPFIRVSTDIQSLFLNSTSTSTASSSTSSTTEGTSSQISSSSNMTIETFTTSLDMEPSNSQELVNNTRILNKVTETETITHYITMTTQEVLATIESTEFITTSVQIKTPTSGIDEATETDESSVLINTTSSRDVEFERLEVLIHELRKEILDQKTASTQSEYITTSSFSLSPTEVHTTSSTMGIPTTSESTLTSTTEFVLTTSTDTLIVPYSTTSTTLISVESIQVHNNLENIQGKSGKDLLNMKSPSYKVDIAPQFQYHEMSSNQLPPSVPYSKPKIPFHIQPVPAKEVSVEATYDYTTLSSTEIVPDLISTSIEPTTTTIIISTTPTFSGEVEQSGSTINVENIAQLPSEDLDSYLTRIYPILKQVMEKKEENNNVDETDIVEDMTSGDFGDIDYIDLDDVDFGNSSFSLDEEIKEIKKLPHNEPYKIYHVPKEMQHEVINNAFKTFTDPDDITTSYERGSRKDKLLDSDYKSSPNKSTFRNKNSYQSKINFDVFGDVKENGGSNFILFSMPSYTAILTIIAITICWI